MFTLRFFLCIQLPSLSGQPLAKFHISSDGIRITDEDEVTVISLHFLNIISLRLFSLEFLLKLCSYAFYQDDVVCVLPRWCSFAIY